MERNEYFPLLIFALHPFTLDRKGVSPRNEPLKRSERSLAPSRLSLINLRESALRAEGPQGRTRNTALLIIL
jgi:hypothetical protein